MSAIDFVLQTYRDTFGVKTERANEIHREACVEVAELRAIQEAAWKLAEYPDSEAKKAALLKLLGVEL